MTTAEIQRLIRAAGREPVERDTLYNRMTPVAGIGAPETRSTPVVQ
jgi:2-iminoacetate synthase ThiH